MTKKSLRFRDDEYVTFNRKRVSDTVDGMSEGDSSSKPTPAKKNRRPGVVARKGVDEKGSDTTTNTTPSPSLQPGDSQGSSTKSPERRLKIDLAKLAKR